MNIRQAIAMVVEGIHLSQQDAYQVMAEIMSGEATPAQIGSFITALRVKGETAEEVAGGAQAMREKAFPVKCRRADEVIDTCGTGGAKLKTFNISTTAALVAAGAGAHVAKHGNRGITSKCGAADVLDALGVNVSPGPDVVAECIRRAGIGFMFAPSYHPAMKYVQPIRKSLEFRTAFNILGPLANPAGATGQVMGVPDESLMERIVRTLDMLGVKRAIVVHSQGLDEISTMSKTKILRLEGGQITESMLDPADYAIENADFEELRGDDAETNAAIVRGVLEGKDAGPRKDIVALNAAAAIIVAGLADDFTAGLKLANESISSGKALAAMDKMVEISNG